MTGMAARLIRHRDAPGYLGMDKNRFRREVKPYLVVIPIGKRGIAYDRIDLDAWADDYKRRNGRPAQLKGDTKWGVEERQDSSKGAVSGTSISGSTEPEFAEVLALIRTTPRKNACVS